MAFLIISMLIVAGISALIIAFKVHKKLSSSEVRWAIVGGVLTFFFCFAIIVFAMGFVMVMTVPFGR